MTQSFSLGTENCIALTIFRSGTTQNFHCWSRCHFKSVAMMSGVHCCPPLPSLHNGMKDNEIDA